MRFSEVSIPMDDFRAWGAKVGNYQFLITLQKGLAKPEYRASWKHNSHLDAPAVHLDQYFGSFTGAEAACAEVWKQLRQKQ